MVATSSPQANGQIERYNRTVAPALSKMILDKGKEWNKLLTEVQYTLNNTVNKATGEIPSKLLFGVVQRGELRENMIEWMERMNENTDSMGELRERASKRISEQAEYNQGYRNRKLKKRERYQEGELVLIRNSRQVGVSNKLQPKFKGPYQVRKVLDLDRYVIGDVTGYQMSGREYEGIFESANLRKYPEGKGSSGEINEEQKDDENMSEYKDGENESEENERVGEPELYLAGWDPERGEYSEVEVVNWEE